MYSPKIKDELIPKLYVVSKAERIRMTTLVNRILEKALDAEEGTMLGELEVNNKESPSLGIRDGKP